ncbi:RHS repeat-associated core domain-containing protein [Apibacter raozihei]|uniref:RHS repeat-associated core domain-containing protein n=1 Tax=Apibacter raozihei TaxID=2500547 RepID=UPI003EDB9961
MDEETGLYYYGARYYNPRESVWLSTDPLSGYNPIFETEHYIDGQHNGGIFNSFNHNTYGYCYQNPVILVDPNGKQARSTTVFGVNGWMHQSYNYYNVPNIKLSAKAQAKFSVGAQIGVKFNSGIVKGKVEAGVATVNVGTVSVGTQGLKAVEWDGTMHNFVGGELSLPVQLGKTKELTIGGKLDYNYEYDKEKADGISAVENTANLDWEANLVLLKYKPTAKLVPGRIEATPKVKVKAGTEFIGLDFGAGIKVVFGVDVNVKFGVEVADRNPTVDTSNRTSTVDIQ